MTSKQQQVLHWIECTQARLQEIRRLEESPSEKRIRTGMNLCFLLEDITCTCFSSEVRTAIRELVGLYMHIDAEQTVKEQQAEMAPRNSAKEIGGAS